MRYGILGHTQAVLDDGTVVALAGTRLRALLTALALRPGRVLGPEVLIDEVWDGDPPADASGALQALVGRLRRVIGHEAIGSVGGGYRLCAEPDDVDLHRFERLVDEGGRLLSGGDPAGASGLLGDALALWRGPALADLPDRGAAAVRCEESRLEAQRLRLSAGLALGRAEQLLPELAELAAAHPLNEPVRALHIRALRDAARTADALAAYEAVRRELADQLGADPGGELRALHAELLNPAAGAGSADARPGSARAVDHAAAGEPDAALTGSVGGSVRAPVRGSAGGSVRGSGGEPQAPSAAPPSRSGNARARLTSFVGRETDLDAIRGDLDRARLVTLTGPGGTGKTRLSQETGDLVADRWPDGVWYAELAPVSDPRTVPEAVLNSLGLRETLLHPGTAAEQAIVAETRSKDPARLLAEYCATRRLLLVLDNCEHVLDAAAALVEQLLSHCPEVTVLATSREPLGVPGELVRPLDPLPTAPALRLLADRGAAARPGFGVDDDIVACAELCRRLDGLPLAIELAAARLRGLTPRQLVDRLDDRFRILTGGSRTALPRQQTLRAVVDWSWDLLDPAERTLLRRLAVFAGGWTLEALEEVCSDDGARPRNVDATARIDAADAASLLGSLVDKSLVLVDLGADRPRYRMLETIAEYAAERLDEAGERSAIERRHLTYFREYIRTADPELRGSEQMEWLERLEREHENLRAALRRAVDAGDEQEALCLVLSCAWFWEIRNYRTESRYWPARVAEMGPDPFAGPVALEPMERGPLDAPPPMPLAQLEEARRWVRINEVAGFEDGMDWWTEPRAVAIGTSMIEMYPPHLPQSSRLPALHRPYAAFFTGRFELLPRLMDETVESCLTHERVWELAFVLQMRAKMNNDVAERFAASMDDIRKSRELFERVGDSWGMAEALAAEAEATANRGDWGRSAECCREAIELARKLGSHQQVPILAVRLGEALINSGDTEAGERRLRAGIEDAARFGAVSDGAVFYGKVVLCSLLAQRGDLEEAHGLLDQMLDKLPIGVPVFISGMLLALKGWLTGRSGDPVRGLRMAGDGLDRLADHPLAEVITPRLAILLAPAVISLVGMLADTDGEVEAGPGAGAANGRRFRQAITLLAAHERLRPTVIPPAESETLEEAVARLRKKLDGDVFVSAYAEGDGLSTDEAVALMRDACELQF